MKVIRKILAIIVFIITAVFATVGTYYCFRSVIGAMLLPFNLLIVLILTQWINHLNRDDEEE